MAITFDFICSHHDASNFDCGDDFMNALLRLVAEQWHDPAESTVIVGLDGRRIQAFALLNDFIISLPSEGRAKKYLFVSAVAVDRRRHGTTLFSELLGEIRYLATFRRQRGISYDGIAVTTITASGDQAGFLRRIGFTPIADQPFLHVRRLPDVTGEIEVRPRPSAPESAADTMFDQDRTPSSSAAKDAASSSTDSPERGFDFFVSHASEDKETIARPLVLALRVHGYRVWFDEFELKVGDSITRGIDDGLKNSRHGIVILSKSFFLKRWTEYELQSLVDKAMSGSTRAILPVWHGVTHDDISAYSHALADLRAVNSSRGIPTIVDEIIRAIKS